MVELDIKEHYSLGSLNTLRLKVKARYFTEVRNLEQLSSAVRYAKDHGLELLVLGGGSNLVLAADFPGMVLKVGLTGIEYKEDLVTAYAGENWHDFVVDTLSHDLCGLENLSLIPGTVGAAPVQNIGAYGVELKNLFYRLQALDKDSGKLVTLEKEDCSFGYRDSIFKNEARNRYVIVSVTLKLSKEFNPQLSYHSLKARASQAADLTAKQLSEIVCEIRREKLPDPEEIGNVGSFFKNPVVSEKLFKKLQSDCPEISAIVEGEDRYKISAAWLIEKSGLKGRSVGGARVSAQHALVIVNHNNATPADILNLSQQIIDEIFSNFDIKLYIEPEIRRSLVL